MGVPRASAGPPTTSVGAASRYFTNILKDSVVGGHEVDPVGLSELWPRVPSHSKNCTQEPDDYDKTRAA